MKAHILNASAGAGKTYQLAYKYVRDVISDPQLYRRILAVTFTNKATEEMKTRILAEINRLAAGERSGYLEKLCEELSLDERSVRTKAAEARSGILHDYSHFTVLTIDTFFQRILRAFIRELGIDLDYNVEIETATMLGKSADALVEQITTDGDLRRWMSEYVRERIEDNEKWDVRDGIMALGGEIFKESNRQTLEQAAPKEEIERIVRSVAEDAARAEAELKALGARATEIMNRAGVAPADFSGKSRSFAHIFPAVAAGEIKEPTATARKLSSTTDGWCPKGSPAEITVAELQPILAAICDGYDGCTRRRKTAAMLRKRFRSFALLTDLYAKVRELCEQENTMLLAETKHVLSQFIADNDAPFIYEKVGNRFDRLMIDEFQDTSAKEWGNFLPLLHNAMSQSEQTTVFIVGDVKQSIYRWRGGDWRILGGGAQHDLRPENTRIINLTDNFRSLRRIVDFNNRIIGRVVERGNAELNAMLQSAAEAEALTPAAADALRDTLRHAYDGHTQTPRKRAEHDGYVSIETFDDRPPLIARIKEVLDRGFRPSDIMILVRTSKDGEKAAETLLAFKSGNTDPRYRFDVMTQEALIIGRSPVAAFVVAALKLSADPADPISRAIYNLHKERTVDTPLTEDEQAFFRAIRLLSPEEAFERIVMHERMQHDERNAAYLQALHEQIIGFCAGRIADIPLFLRWWDEQGRNKSLSVEQSDTTIEITTIHKAKGLEKRVVIIPYCNWELMPKSNAMRQSIVWAEARGGEAGKIGRFPVSYSDDMSRSDFSEEYYRESVFSYVDNVNLLYVALTRAVEALYVCIPAQSRRGRIGPLLLEAAAAEPSMRRIEPEDPQDTTLRYESGEPAPPVAEKEASRRIESVKLAGYPTSAADLRLRLPSQRYFEQQQTAELSPRDFGILMHRAFEESATMDDIEATVGRMQADGVISETESRDLRRMIRDAMRDPRIREWFDGTWDEVRNESEIVVPGARSTRRPDRVMIRGRRAVVVDYKFGEKEAAKYRRQIAEYMRLLRQMGYEEVEGWLWFVKLGDTERVEDE
ncbi:MAG: UvrD-helicase domain-containing protein [Alistipes sp.]|nr:UvrD-helicase domain-containing protein [Alistipes sp.]